MMHWAMHVVPCRSSASLHRSHAQLHTHGKPTHSQHTRAGCPARPAIDAPAACCTWCHPHPHHPHPHTPPLQGCKWQFLVFGGEFKVDFTVSEQSEQLKLSFCLLESSFMQAFEGRWQVRPAAGGQGCVVEHQLAVMPFVALPPAVEAYAGKIFVAQVSDILADLQAELRRREQ
jgi:hypothetical protein